QAVVRLRPAHDHAPVAWVELDAAVLDTAPVRVVGARESGALVIADRAGSLGNERVAAVRADDDTGMLDGVAAADARDLAALEHELVDCEAGANLGAGVGCRLREERVEHDAARGVPLRDAVDRHRGAAQRERADVEDEAARWRTVGGEETVEEAPAAQ